VHFVKIVAEKAVLYVHAQRNYIYFTLHLEGKERLRYDCVLWRIASTRFPVLFLRLLVESVLLTSGQGAERAEGPVGIFALCINW
jgi:hypothetical protein